MKDFWQKLWSKIGRMGRKEFFLNHLYIILMLVALCFIIYVILPILFVAVFFKCYGGGCSEWLFIGASLFIPCTLLLLSNFLLAKRLQDCGICGVRAFILGILLPIILIYLSDILAFGGSDFIGFYPYLIVLIAMCFKKGNPGPNKYGNPA